MKPEASPSTSLSRMLRACARPGPKWLLLTGAVFICLGMWYGPRFTLRWPGVLPECSRQDLVWREGRWYRPGHTVPFDGYVVDYYPNGSIQARSRVRQGRLDGWSIGYHTNGNVQVREYFVQGVSEGVRQKYDPEGRLISEAMIRNGRLHGWFRRWYPDGTLAEAIPMVDGEPAGVAWRFYPSGFVQARAVFEQGQLKKQDFYEDGRLMAEDPFSP